jgi:hypothetical protein
MHSVFVGCMVEELGSCFRSVLKGMVLGGFDRLALERFEGCFQF